MNKELSSETIEQTVREQGAQESLNRAEISSFLENTNQQRFNFVLDSSDVHQMCLKKELSVPSEEGQDFSKNEIQRGESINQRQFFLPHSKCQKDNSKILSSHNVYLSNLDYQNFPLRRSIDNINSNDNILNKNPTLFNSTSYSPFIFPESKNMFFSNQQENYSQKFLQNNHLGKFQEIKNISHENQTVNFPIMCKLTEFQESVFTKLQQPFQQHQHLSSSAPPSFIQNEIDLHLKDKSPQTGDSISPLYQEKINKIQESNIFSSKFLKQAVSQNSHNVNLEQTSKKFINKKIQTIVLSLLLNFLFKKTVNGRMRLLNSRIRQYISDKCDFGFQDGFDLNKNNYLVKFDKFFQAYFKIKQFIAYVDKKIPAFNPNNKVIILILCFFNLCNALIIFLISSSIFFNLWGVNTKIALLFDITQVFWIMQIIFKLNTQFYDIKSIHLVDQRKLIIKNCFTSLEFFLTEIISLIFLCLLRYFSNQAQQDNLSQLFTYFFIFLPLTLKCKNTIEYFQSFTVYFPLTQQLKVFLQVCKIMVYSLIFIHFLACVWSIVLRNEQLLNQDYKWSLSFVEIKSKWPGNYLQSIFLSLSTAFTCQNFLPSSEFELIAYSLIIILCYFWNIIIFYEFYWMIIQIKDNKQQFEKDINNLNSYLQKKFINIEVSKIANLSLKQYYSKRQHDISQEEKDIMKKINHEIRDEIFFSNYLKLLRGSFFKKLFSDQTLKKICQSIEEISLQPKQRLIDWDSKGTIGGTYFYIVSNGKSKENYFFLLILMLVKVKVMENQENESKNKENETMRTVTNYSENKSSCTDINFRKRFEKQISTQEEHGQQFFEENKFVKLIEQGGYFGIREFFTGEESQIARAESQGQSTILRISRSCALEILKQDKKDFQVFCQICDEIMSERKKDFSEIHLSCSICKRDDHEDKDCYLVHFNKKNDYIILKSIYSSQQVRMNINRRKRRQHRIFRWIMASSSQKNLVNSFLDGIKIEEAIQNKMDSQEQRDSFYPKDQFPQKDNLMLSIKEDSLFKDCLPKESLTPKDQQSIKDSAVTNDLHHQVSQVPQSKSLLPTGFDESSHYLNAPIQEKQNKTNGLLNSHHLNETSIICIDSDGDRDKNSNILNYPSSLGIKIKPSLLKVHTNDIIQLLEKQQSQNAKTSSVSQMQLAKEYSSKQNMTFQDSSFISNDFEKEQSFSLPLNQLLFKKRNLSNTIFKETEQNQDQNQFFSLSYLDRLMDFEYYFKKYNHNNIISAINGQNKKKELLVIKNDMIKRI